MTQSSLQTTCAYCGVGCGVSLPRTNDRTIKVSGDKKHPANQGRLCVKGTHLGDVLPLKQRLLFPQINNQRVSWETASQTIANKIEQTVAEHGSDAFAFYLSGQILTEDYYAANKLAKGFLGTANVDTNSRLCMSSAVAAHTRAFGEDAVPANYEDIELADLVVVTGSNLAWAHPVVFQRLQKARADNPHKKLVVIDPRKSATAKEADLHLAIKPGTDGQLFNALLIYLNSHDSVDTKYVEAHVANFEQTLEAAIADVGENVSHQAKFLGVSETALLEFFELFANTEKTTTVWSMGINQSESGVDKSNAIINVHLATGRVGKPGASPFSMTGQPNAMGGREVGGLANQLAVHRLFDEDSIRTVQEFWQAPNMATKPGLKAVDLFDACLEGKIKVLWIMGTNPLASLPDANKIKRALEKVETVIVSDVVTDNDTLAYADIKLPALAWGEKDGTVTNSDRTISRQRGFIIPPGQAKADWAAVAAVAKELGFKDAFNWHHAHEVFVEHASLSKINQHSPHQLDLTDAADISFREYQDWQPKQWPLNSKTSERLFSDGVFSTPTGKANMVPVTPKTPDPKPASEFTLNTGRLRDQWHTMSRTGMAKALNKHTNQFEIHIAPSDAKSLNVQNGDLISATSKLGAFTALARIETAQKIGEVFAPMHWNRAFAQAGGVSNVIESTTDPISGQPATKHSAVALSKVETTGSGFLFLKHGEAKPEWLSNIIHFKTHSDHGELYRLFLTDHETVSLQNSEEVSPIDTKTGNACWATGDDSGLTAWLRVTNATCEWPDLDFLDFAANTAFAEIDREALSLGQSEDMALLGNIVCTCFQVTDRQIEQFFANNPEGSVKELQAELKCGTNCGSCLTEVKEFAAKFKSDTEFVDAAEA